MGTYGDAFNAALGRQIRAEIAASGNSIAGAARDLGIARSALDNYVNGKRGIPASIAYEVALLLGLDPHTLIVRAEERLAAEGSATPRADLRALTADDIDHVESPDLSQYGLAAKRGVRKADQEPYAE